MAKHLNCGNFLKPVDTALIWKQMTGTEYNDSGCCPDTYSYQQLGKNSTGYMDNPHRSPNLRCIFIQVEVWEAFRDCTKVPTDW